MYARPNMRIRYEQAKGNRQVSTSSLPIPFYCLLPNACCF